MRPEEIIEAAEQRTFPDDAVSEMATTFAGREAMLVTAGNSDDPDTLENAEEMVESWLSISRKHGIVDEEERKALVIAGLEQFIDDSRRQAVAFWSTFIAQL